MNADHFFLNGIRTSPHNRAEINQALTHIPFLLCLTSAHCTSTILATQKGLSHPLNISCPQSIINTLPSLLTKAKEKGKKMIADCLQTNSPTGFSGSTCSFTKWAWPVCALTFHHTLLPKCWLNIPPAALPPVFTHSVPYTRNIIYFISRCQNPTQFAFHHCLPFSFSSCLQEQVACTYLLAFIKFCLAAVTCHYGLIQCLHLSLGISVTWE